MKLPRILCFTLVSLLCCTCCLLHAQTKCSFEHYSVEDGLSDATALSMLQDSRGYMWFGTFDGLNKFDGNTFKSYKSGSNNDYGLSSSRIDKIVEDSAGFLWVMTYDGRSYRFDPATEKFAAPLSDDPRFSGMDYKVTDILNFSSRSTWVVAQGKGCFEITSSDGPAHYQTVYYSQGEGFLPSDYINAIYKDKDQNVWILTRGGVVRTREENDGHRRTFFHGTDIRSVCEFDHQIWLGDANGTLHIYDKAQGSFSEKELPQSALVNGIVSLNDKDIFILTEQRGFYLLDRGTGEWEHFDGYNTPALKDIHLRDCYRDKYGEIWIDPEKAGVIHFNPYTRKVTHFVLETDKTNPFVFLPNFFIIEDQNDILWLNPHSGGFCYYNRREKKLEYFHNNPKDPQRRFPNLIHSAFSDKQGNLWLCTHARGIEKVTFFSESFNLYQPGGASADHSVNEVRAIFQDQDKYIWTATKDGYIHLYNAQKKHLGVLTRQGTIGEGDPFQVLVYCITQDRSGNIWLGSKGMGAFRLQKQGESSGFSYHIDQFSHAPDDPYSLSHNFIYTIFEDTFGRIWLGTYGGGINYIEQREGKTCFIHNGNLLKNYPIASRDKVRHITADYNDNIWVGTTEGLVLFNQRFTRADSLQFYSVSHISSDENSLGNNDVHYIYSDMDNRVFLATYGGGLNVLRSEINPGDTPAFESFSHRSGAPVDIFLSITDDNAGHLWLSSERSLIKFDKVSGNFEVYGKNSGILTDYFSEGAVCRTAAGEMLFGSNNGFYAFDPKQIKKNAYVPPIVLNGLFISNRQAVVGGEDSPLVSELDQSRSIVLRHRQNNFTIGYATIDLRDPSAIQYAYKMEGFDKEWNYVKNLRQAVFTNLPAGEYTFRVKSTNSDGIWVDNERMLRIRVLSPFWTSPWAIFFYILCALLIIGASIWIIATIYRLRSRVRIEQHITNMKLNFFTDISHELRTPLTLIASPVEHIIRNEEISSPVREQLQLVHNNTERMLRLVNQILDFRKIQSNKMKLSIEEIAMGEYIGHICHYFMKIAQDKNILFQVIDESFGARVWADRDKVEKIFFNLLSNALKFTPADKSVKIRVSDAKEGLQVEIQDEGAGIPEEKMKRLYDRFESFSSKDLTFQAGTGIGLSLTKELVDLHKAIIRVDSKKGVGTTIKVCFRHGLDHFASNAEIIATDSEKQVCHPAAAKTSPDKATPAPGNIAGSRAKPCILVVEDNVSLLSFLRLVLREKYDLLEATNGAEALSLAQEYLPDFIVSDLMMPVMDGLELARKIKGNINTSHIPLVLLTARTDTETKVEAMKYGVDDYITKPFSSEYLLARIENMIERRKKLQEKYRETLTVPERKTVAGMIEPEAPLVVSQDEKFLELLMDIMEHNMDNSALTVEDLVSEAGIGRSVFFKKIKSLTGLAPVEFIREVRIKRAAQLIQTGEFTISQVTYMVGINDPRYFSRCFKQRFGIIPSEYRQKFSKAQQQDIK